MNRMSRRTMLRLTGGLYTAGLMQNLQADPVARRGPFPGRWKTAVGLNGFESVRSYGYRMDLDEILEFIVTCGFEGVELVDWPRPYPRTESESVTQDTCGYVFE